MDKAEHDRLVEIHEEMLNLLEESKNIVRMNADRNTYEQCKAYWIGAIDSALGEGSYIDQYCTMSKTIKELTPKDEDEEEDEGSQDCPLSE